MVQKVNALKLNIKDNVAVALENLQVGTIVSIQGNPEEISVLKHIPYGHKIATTPIPKKGKVIKYGEFMGIASEDIPIGGHVHVTNVRGLSEQDKENLNLLNGKEEMNLENI